MERRGHVAKGGGSPAFLLVIEVWALANQVSLPICRGQFPPPPGPRNSWFLGSLATERGDSCRHRSDPLQPHGSARTFRRSVPSALRGRGCLCAGVSSGDMVTITPFSRHTQTPPNSTCSGHAVPPECPKTGLEPLTLEEPARWSPGTPPPLGFQDADWPASQPIPHHAP